MIRFRGFALTCLVLLSFTLQSQDPPNIIFLFCDDLNNLDSEVMQQAITPNMDLLKTQGLSFTNAHSNAPICAPSRASIFNGMLPSNSHFYAHNMAQNFWENNPGFDNSVTMFEHFKNNGYDVFGTGKIFHHGATDDQFYTNYVNLQSNHGPWPWNGIDTASNGTPLETGHPLMPVEFSAQYRGIAPLSDVPSFPDYTGWVQVNQPFLYENDSVRDLMTDEKATDVILNTLGSNHDNPFFITAGFYKPHLPFYAPKKYFDLYPIENIQIPQNLADDLADVSSAIFSNNATGNSGSAIYNTYVNISADSTDTNWWLKRHIQGYLACVSFVDDQVGRVIEALENSQYADNTILMFSSDHGLHLGEKFRHHKNSLWDPATHIPLIVKGPGIVSNETCQFPVSLIDIYPTIIDVAQIGDPIQNLDGHSLKPFFIDPINGNWEGPEYVLSAVGANDKTQNFTPAIKENQHFSLLNSDYRFSLMSSGEEELYELSSDPMELNNLTFDPNFQTIKSNLKSELINSLGLQMEDINVIDSLDAFFYGNFEQKLNGWNTKILNGAIASIEIDSLDVYNGDYSVEVSSDSLVDGFNNSVQMENSSISVNLGQLYRLSFYGKVSQGGSEVRLFISRNGLPDYTVLINHDFTLTEEWQEHELLFTYPESNTAYNVLLKLLFLDESIYHLDDIKIRRVLPNGLEENSLYQIFRIYPNPSPNGRFFVKSQRNGLLNVTLYSLMGQVLRHETNVVNSTLDYSELPKGVYIVKLDQDDLESYQKIVID